MENFHVSMGRRLQARRKQLRLTQDELAELANVTPQMVSSAELGKTATRPENIVKLCKAMPSVKHKCRLSTDRRYCRQGYSVFSRITIRAVGISDAQP